MKLDIKDATGQAPAYPVLVQLAMGGPRHGQVILDPDGGRIACNTAAFLWQATDAQGRPVTNVVGYQLGTQSLYVGVQPDLFNRGHVIPVWGTAEILNLSAQAKVQINGTWADPLIISYGIHPEPGKPDHLVTPDTFTFWNGYSTYTSTSGQQTTTGVLVFDDAHLQDVYTNTTYGYTDTAATQPDPNVAVQFTDQTSGSYDDFSAYALQMGWQADGSGQMPAGTFASTLSVTYPNDPAGDWGGGSVSTGINIVLQGGSVHALAQVQSYDASVGTSDTPFPLTVPPGAGQGAIPTTTAGDTPRLVLLALTGTDVPTSVLAGSDQPSLDPNHVYRLTNGTWTYTQVSTPYPTLEVQDTTSSFELAIVDGNGAIVPNTSFIVHTCPRGEHLSQDSPPGDCTDTPVTSGVDQSTGKGTGVLASFTLNAPGSQRGYMGIELTQAPVNPGTYYLAVQSLGPTMYRIRQESQLANYAGPNHGNDNIGGFVICTVLGGEILDGNYRRIDPLPVTTSPTAAYVRLLEPSSTETQVDATVTYDQGGPAIGSITVHLTRIGPAGGGAGIYLGPLFLSPESTVSCPAAGKVHALDIPTALQVAEGELKAYRAGSLRALTGVDSLPTIDIAINGKADGSEDIVTMHPAQPSDVLVTLHGAGQTVNLSVDPAEMATVTPDSVTLCDGDSATVQLAALVPSVHARDIKLVATVAGFSVTERTFTNIDAHISQADIRVEPGNKGIPFHLYPDDLTGLQLTLDLIRSDATNFTILANAPEPGGVDSKSFEVPTLPTGDHDGEFTQVRLRWGLNGLWAEATADHHFKKLGDYTQTQYNTPAESDDTCQGTPVPVCFVDTPCSFIQGDGQTLQGPFDAKVYLNGSGESTYHGDIQKESWCLVHATPPGACQRGNEWHIFRTWVDPIIPACGAGYGLGDSTVARDQNNPDLGAQSECGREVLIFGVGVKTVTDLCNPDPGGEHCSATQLDNYTTHYHRCTGVPSLVPGNAIVVKVWQ